MNVSRVIFVNDAGPAEEYSLDSDGGATVMTQTTEDGYTVELRPELNYKESTLLQCREHLGEYNRLTAKFLPFAMTDAALVGNLAQENLAVIEYPDTVAPIMIASAIVLNVGDGANNMTFDETIDTMIGNCDNDAAFHNDQPLVQALGPNLLE